VSCRCLLVERSGFQSKAHVSTSADFYERNKLRPILKAMENAGAPWATDKPAPPISKQATAKSAGASAKRGRKAPEIGLGGEAEMDESSRRKKRAKATLTPVTEEQDGVEPDVKGECENGTGALEDPQDNP
jgi:hypothetical protein